MFHYVRKFKDGVEVGVIDVPEKDLAETLKRHPDWEDMGRIDFHKIEQPVQVINVIECPICGFTAKNETGLKVHKTKHYA